ncbi:MAG: hypothetical protein CTY12_00710 [Methylotenera sp.]|nr:MAG: hypothetical protein CTY12_00710 [Methylotenera sp.]
MYVIVNKQRQVYNGSINETRHIWATVQYPHFHAVIFPSKEEANDIQNVIGEETRAIPLADL